jgi:alpha-tubulin suppressor-like RCC1 family protein
MTSLFCKPLTRRLSPLLAVVVLLAALSCREETESPAGPGPQTELAVPSVQALSFRVVSPGGFHTCGVTTENLAYCWGANSSGQLGDGTTIDRLTPVPVAGGRRFLTVSADGGGNTTLGYTCGVTTSNRVFCWGANTDGQLGDGTTVQRLTPVRALAPGLLFRTVDAGDRHACALTTDDRAYCWGNNPFGQVGDGTTDLDRRKPVPVTGGRRFIQVSAGFRHTCGVSTNNRAYCWGGNHTAELGDGTVTERPAPNPISSGRRFSRISAGAGHSCAVSTDGRAFCWGSGSAGQIGDGNPYLRHIPRAVAGGLLFRQISAGNGYTCGVTTNAGNYCWGWNWSGQLGDGTQTIRLTPTPLAGEKRFNVLRAGRHNHTCGVTAGSRAYCWGWNYWGQLGDGTTTDRLKPVPVAGGM